MYPTLTEYAQLGIEATARGASASAVPPTPAAATAASSPLSAIRTLVRST